MECVRKGKNSKFLGKKQEEKVVKNSEEEMVKE